MKGELIIQGYSMYRSDNNIISFYLQNIPSGYSYNGASSRDLLLCHQTKPNISGVCKVNISLTTLVR